MGRGKSLESVKLVLAAREILQAIHPASVRAVCYQLFNRKLITSMAKSETNRVSTQLRDARESGIIPWGWIVDETREAECVNAWEDPEAYIETVRRAYRRDRWTDQRLRVEVWSEKGTIRGTLASVLDEYGVTFRVMHGYGSATTVHDVAVQSAHGKPWIVLYVGDWDPSGLHMSAVDLPQRLTRYGGLMMNIRRVALTFDQCITLGEAPSFALDTKQNDSRHDWFRRHYGSRCWELDALSPVVLREAVTTAIRECLDPGAWARAEQTERAERESISSILDTWPGISRQAHE
jgi:hypothetical protein